jgi:AcrR family transcriptional regulator
MDDPLLLTEIRPHRADAVKNRELLVRTAAMLFAERGVDNVTMSEIAQVAGVGKGTLYRHFNNKTELAHALLDHDQRELQARTLRRLPQRNAPIDDLRWFVEEVAGFVTRNFALLDVIGDANAPMALNQPAHFWWWQTIRALLLRCHIEGDVDYAADTLYILLSPQTIRYQTMTHNYDLPRIISGLHQTIDRLVA